MIPRTAFVGVQHGELSIAIGDDEIMLGVDLAIPGVSPFVIKTPLSDAQGMDREVLFGEMLEAVNCLMKTFFQIQGVDDQILQELGQRLLGAVESIGSKYASLPIEGQVEADSYFEAEFQVPELFLEQAHRHIVVANAPIIRRTPPKPPTPSRTAPQTRIVQRPQPSLRNLITRFKGQQNKPLSGPLFVLVYDTYGRPVGVRSIKGPGWSGIGGGGKVASVPVTVVSVPLPVNAAMSHVARYRRLLAAKEHGAVVGVVAFAELPKERRVLQVEVPGARTAVLAALFDALGVSKPVSGW